MVREILRIGRREALASYDYDTVYRLDRVRRGVVQVLQRREQAWPDGHVVRFPWRRLFRGREGHLVHWARQNVVLHGWQEREAGS